jgi:penicillin-binding protein 2
MIPQDASLRNARLVIFQAALFGSLVFLAAALFHIQAIRGSSYLELSERNRIRLIRTEAPRGTVYDRNGVILATSRPSIDLFVVPEDFDTSYTEFVARLLEIRPQDLIQKLNRLEDAPFVPILIKRDVPKEILYQLEEKKPLLTGVFAEVQGVRYYRQDTGVSHVLGYLGKITKEEYDSQEDPVYHFDAWVGRSGVERYFDRLLRGEDGGKQIEVDVRGRQMRVLSEREPTAGQDLILTIDSRLQKRVSEILGDHKGSVAVIDLKSGDILALVSKPDFNPNFFVSPSLSNERLRVLRDRENLPLLNRGVSAGFPPGSVFKVVTALAALEAGKITPQTRFFCRGYFRLGPRSRPFKCWSERGHGSVNFYEAVERSCNVYFYNTGRLVGPETLARYSRELGLGATVEIELPQVEGGIIPDEKWKRAVFHDAWYPGETLNFAIGQGFVLTTPLQIARLIGIIATEGRLPPVHIVKTATAHSLKPWRLSAKPEHMRQLKEAMLRVVQSDRGTGRIARVDFMKLAAKTGTAQVPPKTAHAWFSGFFPYEDPHYALVVFLEHGGTGGFQGARLAKEILLSMKEMGFLPGILYGHPQLL